MAISIPSLFHTEAPIVIMPDAASSADRIIPSLFFFHIAIFTSW